jgi:hypothetical protein
MTVSLDAADDATWSGFAVAVQLNESRESLRRAARRTAERKESAWAAVALEELTRMRELLARHREGARGPYFHHESLYLQAQWLIPRIQQLVTRFDEVELEATLLSRKFEKVVEGEAPLALEARKDTTRLLSNLRRTLTEESYLEIDSFNEPPALD